MRPPRVVIIVAFIATTIFLTFLSLRSSHPRHLVASSTSVPKAGIQSFFSFRAPFSLFPPNAIITLTHENSTAFLARPAAFGPALPTEGLKGRVWIGSGFGDDAGVEGELGCSDVPGWVDSYAKSNPAASGGITSGDAKPAPLSTSFDAREADGNDDRSAAPDAGGRKAGTEPSINDGTDDYLHHPLSGSTVSKPSDPQPDGPNSNHADIQSIQEGAEITGKVVLLSRGGCGFLEKVKWAQRRGAIALIVGDDIKGGVLIQMYARGDTSNVSIPSIFTSRTTAHLLSTLVGSSNYIENSIDENGNPTLKVQSMDRQKKGNKHHSSPTFTTTATMTKATMTARAGSKTANKKLRTDDGSAVLTTERPGWLRSLFFGPGGGKSRSDSSRPPSSGQLDWVLVDDWKADDSSGPKKVPKPKSDKKSDGKKGQQKNKGGDDFVIGVQDWRDPDLVGTTDNEVGAVKGGDKLDVTRTKNSNPRPTKSGKKHTGGALQDIPEFIPPLRGGSITPGSGEYGGKLSLDEDNTKAQGIAEDMLGTEGKPKGLLTAIFGDDEEDVGLLTPGSDHTTSFSGEVETQDENDEYEGLWVTLTPTSGASPFLDTLLVLVVSPLVTLTVVYALLLVRSRIRRRRWRAPKSVVERLPVRTYQTIATSGSQSPRLPSPTSSSASTPLLQSAGGSRPRSRTTTGIPEPGDLARVNSQPLQVPIIPNRSHEHEKNASVSSEWKKYMGRQVECVVCLEEYVDGISRVMSLPCGHEFHVDCITPWLTTRRRTCPICKGDVVRSLARGSASSPRYEPYHDDSDEDIQALAAETVNETSSSALPIPRSIDEEDDDLEQGIASPRPTRHHRASPSSGSWRNILASSLGGSSRSPRPPQEDRNR